MESLRRREFLAGEKEIKAPLNTSWSRWLKEKQAYTGMPVTASEYEPVDRRT